MPAPTITVLPTAPQRSDPSSVFSARADALVAALATFVTETNAVADYLEGLEEGTLNALLLAIISAGSAADKLAYYTGPDAVALADLTAAGRALIGAADAAAQLQALGATPSLLVPGTISGTSYIIQAADKYAAYRLTNASGSTIVVPLNATIAVPIGARVRFAAEGAGGLVVDVEDVAVTIINREDFRIGAQGSIIELHKVDTNTWWLLGDLQE